MKLTENNQVQTREKKVFIYKVKQKKKKEISNNVKVELHNNSEEISDRKLLF